MNVELIRQVAEHLRRQPEMYDQSSWFYVPDRHCSELEPILEATGDDPAHPVVCGTTACVAGWSLLLSGRIGEFGRPAWGLGGTVNPPAPIWIDWAWGAHEVLDVDDDVAEWLFDGAREPDTMPEVLDTLAAGAPLSELQAIEIRYWNEREENA